MDMEELRDLLQKRLYLELQMFKVGMLRQEKEEIYKSSCEIEFYENAYEILMEETEHLGEGMVRGLIYWHQGIFSFLYYEWLGQKGYTFDNLQEYVECMLENIVQVGKTDYREEDGLNGAGADKAA